MTDQPIKIMVATHQRNEFVEITRAVNEAIQRGGLLQGSALVYVPHTTAGVTLEGKLKD